MFDYIRTTEDIVYLSLESLFKTLGLSDVQILNSNMNVLEPNKTYCVFNLFHFEQVGEADGHKTVESVGETVESISHHQGSVQIQVIGDSASSVAGTLHWALQNSQRAYDSFAYNRIKIFGVDRSLRRAPQKREADWVEGYSFDFTISSSLHVKYSYDWVEYITLNGDEVRLPYKNN